MSIKMETRKIEDLLNDSDNESSKFVTEEMIHYK